jgi:hypothetical protein
MCELIVPVLLLGVLAQTPSVSPPAQAYIRGCQRVFDQQYQANRAKLDAMAAQPGPQDTYYYFQYGMMGALSMYEATGDPRYLEIVLHWAETMISKAVVIDHFGRRNWPGPWKSPFANEPIYYNLWELQGTTEFARLTRIILTAASLRTTYGGRATAIYEFVERDVVDKELDDQKAFSWHLRLTKQRGGQMSDKTAFMLRLLVDVYTVGRKQKHLQQAQTLASAFKDRFQSYRGARAWDFDVGDVKNPPDTAHACRFPLAVIDLYRAGIVFTHDDVQGLANLFTKVIWNQSLSDPRFSNFIDGSNGPFGELGPWKNGIIYPGWVALGAFDAEVRKVCDATLRSILAGKHNPSLDYNSSMWGILALSGEMAKNVALADCQKSRSGSN